MYLVPPKWRVARKRVIMVFIGQDVIQFKRVTEGDLRVQTRPEDIAVKIAIRLFKISVGQMPIPQIHIEGLGTRSGIGLNDGHLRQDGVRQHQKAGDQ